MLGLRSNLRLACSKNTSQKRDNYRVGGGLAQMAVIWGGRTDLEKCLVRHIRLVSNFGRATAKSSCASCERRRHGTNPERQRILEFSKTVPFGLSSARELATIAPQCHCPPPERPPAPSTYASPPVSRAFLERAHHQN